MYFVKMNKLKKTEAHKYYSETVTIPLNIKSQIFYDQA